MRFGIDMNTDHTLEEVGKQFDVTRERIRQIEAKALRKLRHPLLRSAAQLPGRLSPAAAPVKDHLLRRWLYTTPLKGAIFELILQQLHLLFDLLVLLILMPHVSPDNFFVYSYRIDKVSPCPK